MERLFAIGLIIGIPFIIACILYAICHGPFIFMNYAKELPDVQTLTHKYDKIYAKRKQKTWLRIHSKIVHAAKHGRRYVSIMPVDYINIPYDEFRDKLESLGYVLENNSEKWYIRGLSIDVSWEEKRNGD